MKLVHPKILLQALQKVTKKVKPIATLLSFGLLTSLTVAQPAQTQGNELKEVKASRNGDETVLNFAMGKPWQGVVPSFLLANPARLVVDLPNTNNEVAKSSLDLGVGDARSVMLAQSGEKTRAVVYLNRNVPYRITTVGQQVLVIFAASGLNQANVGSPALSNNLPGSATIIAPASANPARSNAAANIAVSKTSPNITSKEIKNIDFRRSDDGAGRLIVEMVEGSPTINVRQQGGRLLLDIDGAQLPASLRRRLDVTDFATPVQRVSAEMVGINTRLTLEPKGAFEHAAYQTDNRIVVEVRAIKEDPNKLIQGAKSGYKGDKLSLNFQNIDIRSLLQVFADFTNLNIITSDTVQGSITLRLKDVPWDQALDIVMQAKNLDSRKNGNVVLIAPRDELAAKEKLELERLSQLTALEPVKSEVFQLQYQRAEDIKKMLSEAANGGGGGGSGSGPQAQVSRFLSPRGSASADNRTNQLFVTDVPSKLDEIRKLLSKVDIPIRQVIIEARIVEADDRFGRNLGVKFGFNDRKSTAYQTVGGVNYPVYGAGSNLAGTGVYGTLSGNQQGAIDLSSQSSTGIAGLSGGTAASNTNFVNLPAAGIGGASPASFALSLFGAGLTKFINLEVSALEAENRGKIISSPRVVTSDSTKATIQSGTEIPYTTTSSSGTTTTFKKAVLKLEVTPQITPEGNVIMDVEVNKDSRGELTPNAGFAIDTKQIKTQVLVENGGTVVIGGVYTQEESNQTSKVPFFGDIPFIGNLFKSNQKVNNRSELLIFLTPRVIINNALGSNGLGQQ
jgi:type IV pilus assembly protein PilQ